MKKTLIAVLGTGFTLGVAHADVGNLVGHWTYDTPTLTVVGGNITGVAESTGNHNASPGSGLGAGGAFTSNPIPASNSVAGQFGQGLTLTGAGSAGAGGGQFLMFPEITEIMAVNGAPAYTVSMWVNVALTTFNVFNNFSDWGNSSTTPGRFSYAFGVSGAAQMRGQTRFDNGGAAGADIFARSVNTPTLNNAGWHMLTWTFDTPTGTLRSYCDATLLETFTSTAASFQMVTASSAFGTLGLKGDSAPNFINGSITFDEMYVFTGVASDAEILNLYNLNAVPEPGSCGLAALGALLLGARRRKLTTG